MHYSQATETFFFPVISGGLLRFQSRVSRLRVQSITGNRSEKRVRVSPRGNNLSYSIAMLGQIPVAYSNYPIE